MHAPASRRFDSGGFATPARRTPQRRGITPDRAPVQFAALGQLAGLVVGAAAGVLAVALLGGISGSYGIVPAHMTPDGVGMILLALAGGLLTGASLGGLAGGSAGLMIEDLRTPHSPCIAEIVPAGIARRTGT